MVTKITNGKVIVNNQILEKTNIYIKGGEIASVTEQNLPFDNEINAEGLYVSPGFIDMHVHGGGGFDFMDGGIEPILGAANLHLEHGTTSLLATTLACSTNCLVEFLGDLKKVIDQKIAPNIIGAHLEGPYFALSQSGAQNPDYIKAPKKDEYEMICNVGKGYIKRWSFAPELQGSAEFCKYLKENGIVPSVGHSDATYDDVKAVYEQGLRLITHFYSCVSTITRHKGFRKLGIIESTYLLDDMEVEIIADGCHLPKELIALILKLLGTDKVSLVTDAMRGAGMPDGESFLGRIDEATPCIIEDGVAKLTDKSGFAGSVATADRLIRTMLTVTTLPNAVKMMTENPAKILGLSNKGKIQNGYDADIVLFDENINIKTVIVGGEVYNKKQ